METGPAAALLLFRCISAHPKSIRLRLNSTVAPSLSLGSAEYRLARPLQKYGREKIRNFAIIAHIDHGKSTLADRLLQLTNVIPAEADAQYLDKLEVERQRGITVKTVDTPGHVDFSFEVKRSLITCDGAILLVAANQGVQAQTVFNFQSAFENNLTIIPVINKVDMPVDVGKVEAQLCNAFGFNSDEIMRISAKNGLNVPDVLEAIVKRIPPPTLQEDGPCKAHVFDSSFDHFKGALLFVVVKQGTLRRNEPVRFFSNPQKEFIITDVGILHPETTPSDALYAGQMGYIYCGIKSTRDVLVGDTLFHSNIPVEEIKPYLEIGRVKPTVYSGLFPLEPMDHAQLREAVEGLQLNDPSVSLETDTSAVFGQGWRVGFVGNLHMEVFGQRLEQEYGELAVFTSPSVEYLADIIDSESVRKRRYRGQAQISINKPADYPEHATDIERFLEPMSLVSIVTPSEYFPGIEQLCRSARGEPVETSYLDETRMLLRWRLPLAEIIVDFFDNLKRQSSGYASFEQKDDGYKECKLERLNISVNGKIVDELSTLCPVNVRAKAEAIVRKLSEEIPRQQYEVQIRATVGRATKAIVSKVLKPMRKDFTGVMKGNMVADRMGKKLKHQKEGKERMKSLGTVRIPREAFLNITRK